MRRGLAPQLTSVQTQIRRPSCARGCDMEPKFDRHMEANLDPEVRRGLNNWATYSLIALATISANILFDVAKINVTTWTTSIVYGTSLVGFLYLYLSAAKFVTSVRKKDSANKNPPGLQ
jgi:hypothetical protein